MARSLVALLTTFFLLSTGCGGEQKVDHVTGTVRWDGKPVAKVVVIFMPSPGRPSWGLTDENGKYKLHYTRGQEGAMRGTHKVYFSHRACKAREEGKDPPDDVKALIEKFGDKETTPLRYEVTKHGQVIDINID